VDVALVVGAVHGWAVERQMLASRHTEPDARQREAQTHARVAENVQNVPPPEQYGQKDADRRRDQHVDPDGQECGSGSNGRNHDGRQGGYTGWPGTKTPAAAGVGARGGAGCSKLGFGAYEARAVLRGAAAAADTRGTTGAR